MHLSHGRFGKNNIIIMFGRTRFEFAKLFFLVNHFVTYSDAHTYLVQLR